MPLEQVGIVDRTAIGRPVGLAQIERLDVRVPIGSLPKTAGLVQGQAFPLLELDVHKKVADPSLLRFQLCVKLLNFAGQQLVLELNSLIVLLVCLQFFSLLMHKFLALLFEIFIVGVLLFCM